MQSTPDHVTRRSNLSINFGATNINDYVLQAYVRAAAAAVSNLVHNITNLSLFSGPKFCKCYDQSFHLAFTISSNKTFKELSSTVSDIKELPSVFKRDNGIVGFFVFFKPSFIKI